MTENKFQAHFCDQILMFSCANFHNWFLIAENCLLINWSCLFAELLATKKLFKLLCDFPGCENVLRGSRARYDEEKLVLFSFPLRFFRLLATFPFRLIILRHSKAPLRCREERRVKFLSL